MQLSGRGRVVKGGDVARQDVARPGIGG